MRAVHEVIQPSVTNGAVEPGLELSSSNHQVLPQEFSTLPNTVKTLRGRLSVSQSALAKKWVPEGKEKGVNHSFISRLEGGGRSLDEESVLELIDVFDASLERPLTYTEKLTFMLHRGYPPHAINDVLIGFATEILEAARDMSEKQGFGALDTIDDSSEVQTIEAPTITPAAVLEEIFSRNMNVGPKPQGPPLSARPESQYSRIANEVLKRIQTGEYTDQLPSRGQLAGEFSSSTATVDVALTLLQEMGYVDRSKGLRPHVKGTMPEKKSKNESQFIPKWSVVAAQVRESILDGTYKGRLPSLVELSRELGCDVGTVVRALRGLKHQELVYTTDNLSAGTLINAEVVERVRSEALMAAENDSQVPVETTS